MLTRTYPKMNRKLLQAQTSATSPHLVAELVVHVYGGQEAVERWVRVDPAHWKERLRR